MRRNIAGTLLIVAAATVTACAGGADGSRSAEVSSAPRVPSARASLSCAGGKQVTTTIDHDDTTRETRSPQEQASSFPGRRTVTFVSDERVDIAVADPAGRVTSVLAYHNDGDLGWRLREMFSCP